jgi:putative tricarboxylic transport membrane protein
LEAGEIRVLATLTADPMGGLLEGVPTAKEQGYDTEWIVFRGFYGPGGMSDEAYNYWVNALGEMADSPEWEEQLQQGGVEKIVRLGPDFDAFVRTQIGNFRQLSADLGLIEGGEEAPAAEAAAPASDFTPGAVECIAPANPGGGWDWTCRAAGQVLSDIGLVKGTVKVTNMAGGGGGVAFANVVTQQNDNDNLIVAASPATTLRLAQGQFGEFTEDDVRWIGSVGADFAVISVAKDSPYQTLEDLMIALKDDPNAINFGGGSAIGGQDHMKAMVLAQAAGLDPLTLKYTPFDGGGEAMTAMLGGFVDVFPGDVSEVLGQLEAGEIRVLATLTADPMGGLLEGVPTAKEQGYDTEWIVFRGFYGPGGMSDEAYNYWVNALGQMADSPEWEAQLQQGGVEKIVRLGPDFDAFVRNQIGNFRQLSQDLGLIE